MHHHDHKPTNIFHAHHVNCINMPPNILSTLMESAFEWIMNAYYSPEVNDLTLKILKVITYDITLL